ncbi:MAG TPA: hypothetical protein VFX14_21195 [Methylomirabilota bacterium]|nr:hypothetical protein [Methylomirabilota bacterium]
MTEATSFDSEVRRQHLFYRADMVETAWKIATPILDVWRTLPPRDSPSYAAGSWRPASAEPSSRPMAAPGG